MINGMKVLATIPARGGSKRFPKKNITSLQGKSLIAYTIEAALACKMLDRIVISTEDKSIAKVANEYDVTVINRPTALATDEAKLGPVCQHALLDMESRDGCFYEIHVLLQPTSPLRTADHINTGLRLFRERDCDSVLAMQPSVVSPYWMRVIEDNFVKPFLPNAKYSKAQRKQELPPTYYPNGALYITYRSVLIKKGDVLGSRITPMIMTIEDSVDIDTEFDLHLAETLLRRRMERKLKSAVRNKT